MIINRYLGMLLLLTSLSLQAQSATMEYVAPITDFSFDFGDLELKRVD